MVSLYLYQLLSLTDYPTQTMPSREAVGWGLVMTVIISVIVNLIKFLFLVFRVCKLKYKARKFNQARERHLKYLE